MKYYGLFFVLALGLAACRGPQGPPGRAENARGGSQASAGTGPS